MAGFDYTDTYYDVYYWFVSDSDTGSGSESDPVTTGVLPKSTGLEAGLGTDGGESISIRINDADTGSGSENSTQNIKIVPVSQETASGLDNGTRVELPVQLFTGRPPGLISPASFLLPVVPAYTIPYFPPPPGIISDLDSGSFTESDPVTIALSDADFSSSPSSFIFQDEEQGTFLDLQFVGPPPDSDAGTFADTNLPASITDSDLGLFFDVAQAAQIGIVPAAAGQDTGSGLDLENPIGTPISDTDTGHGAESNGTITPDIIDADTGSFLDAETPPPAHLITAETATGDDEVLNLLEPKSDSDTASGIDAQAAGPLDTDTGHGLEANGPPRVVDGDSYTGTDAGAAVNNQRFDFDLGHFTDAETPPPAHLSDSDLGHSQENAGYDDRNLLFGTVEAFSISRCSVLNGAGAETAQLYGVQSGIISPQFTTTMSTADDISLWAWTDLAQVEVQITGGFIPFAAANNILGLALNSNSTQYAMSFGLQKVNPAAAVSLVLRCPARDYRGRPRTLDLVLYEVRFRLLEFTIAYKTGMGCNFTASAFPTTQDEAGNTLSSYEVGRLVFSPGQLTGAVSGVFGQGT